MSDASGRDEVEVFHLTTCSSELEQVSEVNALAWTQNLDKRKIREKAEQLREEVQKNDPEEKCLIKAIRSNRIVGFAQASLHREERSSWMFARLVVHPQHRRAGVATALFEACTDYARERGAVIIKSETHTDNADSIASHEALGFNNDGVFEAPDGDMKVGFSLTLHTKEKESRGG